MNRNSGKGTSSANVETRPPVDILVVDDDPASLRILSDMLEEAGYRVRATDDPGKGLDAALKESPLLIVLETRMPGMDGFEVCRRLKQDAPTRDIPIIFISSLHDAEDRVRGFEAGGVDSISKPFQEQEVLARVKTQTRLRRMELGPAQRVIEEGEERFRQLLQQSPLSIQIVNPDGRIEEVNQAFKDLWGIPEEDLPEVLAKYNMLEDEEARKRGIMPFIRKAFDGESVVLPAIEYDAGETVNALGVKTKARKVWIQARLYPVKNEKGEVVSVVDIEEDITERKEAEKRQEHFRALIEQAPLAIEIHSVDGRFLSSNPAYSRISGLHGAELQAVKESFDLRRDEQLLRQGFGPLLERLYAGEAIEFETHSYNVSEGARGLGIEVADAGSVWLHSVGFPLKNSAGRTEAVVLMSDDITERKQAEENLEHLRAYTDHLIETASIMIVSLDARGRVIHFNPAAETITGHPLAEVAGKDWFELLAPRDRYPEVHEEFERLVEGGLPQVFENPIVTKAGEERYVSWRNSEVTRGGAIVGVTSFGIDITERKQAEERLRNYQDRLRALALELTLTEEQERKRIASELHDGVAQSLAFARIQLASAQKAVAETPVATKLGELSGLLKDSLQQIRDVLLDLTSPALNEIGLAAAFSEWLEEQAGRRHGLQTSFSDEIDDALLTDDVRTVIFRNARELVMNAIKHAHAKRISVSMASSGNALKITISDDGVGFDPEAVAGRPSNEGAFGLFSIRERMADLAGALEIESEPGKGCRATLVAPLEKEGA